MSRPPHLLRSRRAGVALALGFAFAAVPAAAQAQTPVDLGTAGPFVVLGGSAVTNTGPSVLNGDLGVAPGTSLTGFGLPAVVNGATHGNDAVAAGAQAALTNAYDVAAGQPVLAANDLSGTNLGNRTLPAGAYRYTGAAQLTGVLRLDAAGDPNAQFVFQIASALTTAPASSVVLINGASPCNVFWQVGSSATLDTTTTFQGNLMALASISLNNAATVQGRLLARNGQVSLINNVINASMCGTSTSPPTTPTPTPTTPTPTTSTTPTSTSSTPTAGAPPTTGSGDQTPSSQSAVRTRRGTAILRRTPRTGGSSGSPACAEGFRATVRGRQIRRVVFRLDGKRIAGRNRSPFRVFVRAAPGRHHVTARVTFKDATRARTLRLRYRACSAAQLQPRPGPSQFTG